MKKMILLLTCACTAAGQVSLSNLNSSDNAELVRNISPGYSAAYVCEYPECDRTMQHAHDEGWSYQKDDVDVEDVVTCHIAGCKRAEEHTHSEEHHENRRHGRKHH